MANALLVNPEPGGTDVGVVMQLAAYAPDIFIEIECAWDAAAKAAWDFDGYLPWFIGVDFHDLITDVWVGPRDWRNFSNGWNIDYTTYPAAGWWEDGFSLLTGVHTEDTTWHVLHARIQDWAITEAGIDGDVAVNSGDIVTPNYGNLGGGGVSAPFGDAAARSKIAGSFQPDSTGDLGRIGIRLGKNGTPTDNVVVQICADASGSPGTVLDTQTIPGTSLPGDFFLDYSPGIALDPSTTTWVVVSRSGAVNPTNYYVYVTGTGNGELYDSGTATWGALGAGTSGLVFEIRQLLGLLLALAQFFVDPVDATVAYRSVKVGTGGYGTSDLFSEDWATGNTAITSDFASYLGTIGTNLNVVSDPFSGPNFSLVASPAAITIAQGSVADVALSTTALGGDTEGIVLSASGEPAGVTVTFAPGSIVAGDSSVVSVDVAATAALGTYTITLTATGDTNTHSVVLTLTVVAPTTGPAAFQAHLDWKV